MDFKVKQSLKGTQNRSRKITAIGNFARKTTRQLVVESYSSGGVPAAENNDGIGGRDAAATFFD